MLEQMTARERITAALKGQSLDRIPFCPFLAYVWEYFPHEIQQRGQLAFHAEIGADPLWRGAPCPVVQEVPGIEVRWAEDKGRINQETITPVGALRQVHLRSESGNTHFLIEHPLKTEEDYKVQLWIEEHTQYNLNLQPVQQHFAGEGCEGLSFGMLVPRGKTAFQLMIEHLAGTEELQYALIDFPETVETLWQAMMANNLRAAALAAEAPYDYFITWEDSSTQNYSPLQYEQFITPEIRQYCAILGAQGKAYIQHACGHVKDLVAHMKADGVYAVESLSPPPTGNLSLRDARALIGAEMGIIGGIEPVHFLDLPFHDLEAYVEQVIADGAGGPFILANSDSCPPGVTVEKFKLVADVARRHLVR